MNEWLVIAQPCGGPWYCSQVLALIHTEVSACRRQPAPLSFTLTRVYFICWSKDLRVCMANKTAKLNKKEMKCLILPSSITTDRPFWDNFT